MLFDLKKVKSSKGPHELEKNYGVGSALPRGTFPLWLALPTLGQPKRKIEGEKIERDFHKAHPEIPHQGPDPSETKKPVSVSPGLFR